MSNALQHASVTVFPQDRRFLRRAVNSLGCICLTSDSVGIVLNVSEDGLAVSCTAVPAPQSFAPLKFQLPESSDWITAHGKVVWTNVTKTEAGLQFVDLVDSARKQIREWISLQNHSDDSAVLSRMEQHVPLPVVLPRPADASPAAVPAAPADASSAIVPANPAVASPTATGDLILTPETSSTLVDTSDDLDRRLRAIFAQHIAASALAPSDTRRRRRFVLLVSSLASLALVIGLVAGWGKLNALIGSFTNSTGNPAESGPSVPKGSPLATNETPSRAADPAQAARITVTVRFNVPISDAQGRASKAESLRLAQIDRRVDPEYPPQAIDQHIQGTVQLRASISAGGTVRSIVVMSGPPLLASSAVNALRSWHCTPTLLDDKPVETEANIAIVFSLSK